MQRPSLTLPALYLIAMASIAGGVMALGWDTGWGVLFVDTISPVFGDMRPLQGALSSLALGFDPYVENPGNLRGTLLNYPPVWLPIATFLGLGDETRYLTVILFYEVMFLAAVAYLLYRFPSWFFLMCALSGAVLMGIERANVDIFFFAVLVAAMLLPNGIRRAALILVSAVLKLYPILAAVSLVSWGRKDLSLPRMLILPATVSILFVIYLALFWTEIMTGLAATAKAGKMSYGVWVLGFLANERFPALPVSLPLLYAGYAGVIVLLVLVSRSLSLSLALPKRGTDRVSQFADDLFLTGAAIYGVSFLAGANWDYRMVLCLFCVPFMLRSRNGMVVLVFQVLLLLALNQFLLVGLGGVVGGAINVAAKTALHLLLMAALICRVMDEFGPRLGLPPARIR